MNLNKLFLLFLLLLRFLLAPAAVRFEDDMMVLGWTRNKNLLAYSAYAQRSSHMPVLGPKPLTLYLSYMLYIYIYILYAIYIYIYTCSYVYIYE